MRTGTTRLALVCMIGISGFLFAADQLMADHCGMIAPHCRQCLPDDSGGCCESSGNCGCFYILCPPEEATRPVAPLLKLFSPATSCRAPQLTTSGLAGQPEAKPQAPLASDSRQPGSPAGKP
jgi:hypothetical protein